MWTERISRIDANARNEVCVSGGVQESGTFVPAVKAAWLFDYIADRAETTARFAGGGPSLRRAALNRRGADFYLAVNFHSDERELTLTGNWDLN